MEFKGTKGVWKLFQEGLQKYVKCGTRYIALVHYGNEEHNANAKLISYAPEMLEMLELLTTVYSADNIEKAKLLIKKATKI